MGWYVQVRVAVRRTLPLDIERTEKERTGASGSAIGTLGGEWQCHPHEAARSGSSGSVAYTAKWHRAYRIGTLRSEWQCNRYARGRVAVQLTLPLGGERVVVERSGPSGSMIGTFRPEWQCDRYARARVAVSPTRGRTLRGEWQCRSGRPSGRRALCPVPGCAPRGVIPSLTRNGPSANSGAF